MVSIRTNNSRENDEKIPSREFMIRAVMAFRAANRVSSATSCWSTLKSDEEESPPQPEPLEPAGMPLLLFIPMPFMPTALLLPARSSAIIPLLMGPPEPDGPAMERMEG